mmetsp:Transcript_40215/g.66006  ORF Transcript_40215/g.66006 Transcript_40215/m.66006 type:complete len:131 (+) Transcript_40215:2-394(+)
MNMNTTSSTHCTQQMNVVIDNTKELNVTLGSSISSIQSVFSNAAGAASHVQQMKKKCAKNKGVKILDPSHPSRKINVQHQHLHAVNAMDDTASSSQSQSQPLSKVSSTTTTLLDYRSSDEEILEQQSFTP